MSGQPEPILIKAKGLRKQFGDRTAVDGIDLNIRPGLCFGLLGPNGAGKTTTLRLLLGLTPFDDGELSLFDMTMPQQAREIRARVGIVPQADTLDPDFSVAANLSIYGSYFGISRKTLA